MGELAIPFPGQSSGVFALRPEEPLRILGASGIYKDRYMFCAWTVASRPKGLPISTNFRLATFPDPELKDGEFRVHNTWLSVEPYHRARMNDIQYAPCFKIGEPMFGTAVGEVIESRHPRFAVGDRVFHSEGYRDKSVVDPARDIREGVSPFKLPEIGVPEQSWLGNLGLPGITAYFGLLHVGNAKAGDILFVSAAAGAVGSTVVQIAKAKGMTVIGSAGGPEKCAFVKKIGADAVVDYKSGSIIDNLPKVAKNGIDVYFDNVSGSHLEAALAVARPHARFVMCGMIGDYNKEEPVLQLHNARRIIHARARLEGFYCGEFSDHLPEFYDEMGALIRTGKVVQCETVMDGLEKTPEAFLGLFSGRNIGKMLVKL